MKCSCCKKEKKNIRTCGTKNHKCLKGICEKNKLKNDKLKNTPCLYKGEMDFDKKNCKELKDFLRTKKCKISGRKKELIERYKRAFNNELLKEDLSGQKNGITNETTGITAEKVLCDLKNLEYKEHIAKRSSKLLEEKIRPIFKKFSENELELYNNISKHIGSKNGASDYELKNGQTLSLKAFIEPNPRICPQNIGQPSKKKWTEKILSEKDYNKVSEKDIRNHIKKNIKEMTKLYFDNLFCCDYLLMLVPYTKCGEYYYVLINKSSIKYKILKHELFKWTNIWEDNESSTLKYGNLNNSLGEYQMHNNRDCIKFRFIFKGLVELFELQKYIKK